MDLETLRQDPELRAMVTGDEGRRSKPYKDTRGIWSGGVGHNIESHGETADLNLWLRSGIPDETIERWFNDDIDAAITCCAQIFSPEFETLPDEVQRVLVDMAFDLMYELWDWHLLRAAIAAWNWDSAARCIARSLFASQAPNRCKRLEDRLMKVPQ